jgi:hypothetical protein
MKRQTDGRRHGFEGEIPIPLKSWFSPPLPVNGKQFFADRVEYEFTGGDVSGFAEVLDAVVQGFGNVRADAVIACRFWFFTHCVALSGASRFCGFSSGFVCLTI